ncbi:MAG: hypothetical protein E6661_21890 [Enterobacter sp.]|uniref:hypothetical protein n=1 Tax=Enterobacter TaxID=547 RepID=UPI00079909D7|nr:MULTISPECIES: hypothetical protein [Enterobacter]MCR2770097.1 hypothetical protein [Enterobacter kobei]MCU4029125.1 hypothetical protein [Enterobacter roggenkampii]MDU6060926.1 hypothetical protein [Enterobacter sp.]URE96796.1 hypothetical protein LK774_08345 [Enterobacter kobei]SAF37801.1 Uncharacterised protein [Enterobacter roggenkampii]
MNKSIPLSIPEINVRHVSYKGYPISIMMLSADTFVYELHDNIRVIECSTSDQVMYIDKHGLTAVITRDSLLYKELLHRIMNGDVLEDGNYQYQPVTIQ